jgi:hypothetical protein
MIDDDPVRCCYCGKILAVEVVFWVGEKPYCIDCATNKGFSVSYLIGGKMV